MNHKPEPTIIAIANNREQALNGKWEFITYANREEALQSLENAKKQGKIAVFYQNGFDRLPPEI
ncbi:MAG: hypothetical protein WBV73_03400 [Phormidium sp.]